ncbi:hypothetical protein BC670_3217 [Flavobacterium branchiophilum]|uniref:Uncharacterized protein n=1 Tax=Flavobacterium branchiophilum TaxID=55197 RepID=A0A543G7Y0_9FLAO|nr:hypothetical protein BC670_3217 [Flavobacterium branchiophilum]
MNPVLGVPQGSGYPFQTTFIKLKKKYNIVK